MNTIWEVTVDGKSLNHWVAKTLATSSMSFNFWKIAEQKKYPLAITKAALGGPKCQISNGTLCKFLEKYFSFAIFKLSLPCNINTDSYNIAEYFF